MNPFAVNAMLKQPITFDRFIRSLLGLAVIVTIGLLINRLSSVLLPFFVAWSSNSCRVYAAKYIS